MEHDLLFMSLVTFLPSLFALPLMLWPLFVKAPATKEAEARSNELVRWWALLGSAATLMMSILIFIDFQGMRKEAGANSSLVSRATQEYLNKPNQGWHKEKDYIARYPWIRKFNIEYYLGIDGISMPLVLLTTALSFLAILASWKIEKFVRGYMILFLVLETGMLGTFLSLDFFLFYIFWEVMLLPMYFLIGIWGGPRREYAAIKFFLYTLLGSVLILIAMLGCYFTDLRPLQKQLSSSGTPATKTEASALQSLVNENAKETALNTFSLPLLHIAGRESARLEATVHETKKKIEDSTDEAKKAELTKSLEKAEKEKQESQVFSRGFQITMFILLFIGFAIKVPLFPFHTWLPDAHVEAPTPISMILAGVLLKLGGYGIIRIAYPICPWAGEELAWWIGLFAMINIVYGAFAAMAQTDFKKLVAYSSVSHMGYVILGIAVWSRPEVSQYWAWGMNGAMYQMIAHGISSAGMFFLVGVIYDRAHHRDLNNFRGLMEPMPLYGGISAIIFFAALGLPGLCGFVGEFMVVLSTWNFSPTFAILAALTVVLTAAYILWTIQRVYFGTNPAYKNYTDMDLREVLCILPLIVLAVLLGVFPDLLLGWMTPSVNDLVHTLARVVK